MHRITHLFRWLNVFTIIGTFLAYLSPFVNPSKIWFFTFFGTGYSWLLLLNVLFIVFWIVLKRWYFLLSLATILVGWNFLTTYIGFNLNSQTAHSSAIKVMSYNIEGLEKIVNKKQPETKQQLRDNFFQWMNTDIEPDILCTQETGWQELVPRNTPLVYNTRNQGVAIFSKFPFVQKGEINFPDTYGNACVWADVRLPDNTIIRVYSTHLRSNHITGDTGELIENADLQEKETWLGIKNILAKYKYAAEYRVEQAQLIIDDIKQCPYPVLLCGDFNETPLSYIYQLFTKRLNDTFEEGALGIGTTFSGIIPGLKLDYILSDQQFQTIHHKIHKNKTFSDHYPIISTLQLKE